jgi:hypothetical protein
MATPGFDACHSPEASDAHRRVSICECTVAKLAVLVGAPALYCTVVDDGAGLIERGDIHHVIERC